MNSIDRALGLFSGLALLRLSFALVFVFFAQTTSFATPATPAVPESLATSTLVTASAVMQQRLGDRISSSQQPKSPLVVKSEQRRLRIELKQTQNRIDATRREIRKERLTILSAISASERDIRRAERIQDRAHGKVERVNAELLKLDREIAQQRSRYDELVNSRAVQGQRLLETINRKEKKRRDATARLNRYRNAALKAEEDASLALARKKELESQQDHRAIDEDVRVKRLLVQYERSELRLKRLRVLAKQMEQSTMPSHKQRPKSTASDSPSANSAVIRNVTAQSSELGKTPEETYVELAESAENDSSKNEVSESTTYVYVISGADIDIERILNLNAWVITMGGQYIEGRWNRLYGEGDEPDDTSLFEKQFLDDLMVMPSNAKLVLIGHGLGGAAVIKASYIAAQHQREVDMLVTIDPVGEGRLRANIVYAPEGEQCQPLSEDVKANTAYQRCIATSPRREISPNVKYFYNRWQKQAGPFADFKRQFYISPRIAKPDMSEGEMTKNRDAVPMLTSTGRFLLRDALVTVDDQKRAFYHDAQEAHARLLDEVAADLPRLLVGTLQ